MLSVKVDHIIFIGRSLRAWSAGFWSNPPIAVKNNVNAAKNPPLSYCTIIFFYCGIILLYNDICLFGVFFFFSPPRRLTAINEPLKPPRKLVSSAARRFGFFFVFHALSIYIDRYTRNIITILFASRSATTAGTGEFSTEIYKKKIKKIRSKYIILARALLFVAPGEVFIVSWRNVLPLNRRERKR